jgi:beta-galactosidase
MKTGTSWYPEHWPEERWAADLELMRSHNLSWVRVADFAWSSLEPSEGRYELDWLERAVNLAGAYGFEVVVATPTAGPPAWLTQRYPEVLAVREDGRRASQGRRCHYSPANVTYKHLARSITEEVARCLGHNPYIVGWQIENEFNSVSWDEDTRRQFQTWLHEKYGSLEELNRRWWLRYWSQEYSAWAQIPLPINGTKGVDADGFHHPSLLLDWQRFVTHLYQSYQQNQLEVIRAYKLEHQWITHNYIGGYQKFDQYKLAEPLDFASLDSYVAVSPLDAFGVQGHRHDLIRGLKKRNFWAMEVQPGHVNYAAVNRTLEPGESRRFAWHLVGHGADAIGYWQWRGTLAGQEQYHGTLLDQSGRPRPILEEVTRIGAEFAKARAVLEDTIPSAQVALLHSYEDRWILDAQRHHKDFDPVQHLLSYYRPLRERGLEVDIVRPSSSLDSYQLVIAPCLHLLEPNVAEQLEHYVRNGGHLLLGPRSGVKDSDNAFSGRPPGSLSEWVGAEVQEFYALPEPVTLNTLWGVGQSLIWAERLEVKTADVEILATYGVGNGWLEGRTALVSRALGKGRVTLNGTWLRPSLMESLTSWLLEPVDITPKLPNLARGVEFCRRVSKDKTANSREVWILINHMPQPQTLELPQTFTNVLTDERVDSSIALDPHDVAVLVSWEI